MLNREQLDNLIESVKYGVQSIKLLTNQQKELEEQLEEINFDIKEIDSKISFLTDTKNYYIQAVDILYEESIGALKDTLNTAIKYIMYDKNYSCNISLEDKRGTKNIEISLIDNDDNFEVDLKDGVGQGVRTIISFILKAYYLINKDSKLLFLDEKYSALSENYVQRFFEFMKRMADERGMVIVIITHDTRFMEYADRTYMVNDGYATVIGESEKLTNEET